MDNTASEAKAIGKKLLKCVEIEKRRIKIKFAVSNNQLIIL